MKILRWIVYCPLSLAAFLAGLVIVPYLLGVIFKIMYFVMFAGTKYDMPPFFDYEYAIEDFKAFIFTTCLGTIISGGISGALAGSIAPKCSKPGIAIGLYLVPMVALLVWLGVVYWDSEHWFYSTCMEITLLITALVSIACMGGTYDQK